MKYTIITLLFVLMASCLGKATGDRWKGQFDSNSSDSKVTQVSEIEDEYWPFEKTVKQSDPYLSEVVKQLERPD